MSHRQPYKSPEQKLSDYEALLDRSQDNEMRLAARVAELEGSISAMRHDADVLTVERDYFKQKSADNHGGMEEAMVEAKRLSAALTALLEGCTASHDPLTRQIAREALEKI